MSIEITTTDAATKSGILDALGTKAYTQSEKTKLEGLETSKYKGLYVDFDSLTGAYPTGEGGYYADVDSGVGEDVVRYIYDVDDTGWVLQLGESTAETAASIKTKYESNANTNAFTDANLDRITGDNFSVVGDLTVDSTTLHVDSSDNNVGIGTTSPDSSYKLDVNGDTRISGDVDISGQIEAPNQAATTDDSVMTRSLGDTRYGAAATTSSAGIVELATDAEAHAATDTTRAITPSNLLIKKDGTAIVAGDLTGNSRGSNALDVQSGRSGSTPVASGSEAIAVGFGNTASNVRSITFGFENTASAGGGIGIGYQNTTSGNFGSSAFGYKNTASGYTSTSMGAYNTASGLTRASAVGYSNTASGDQSSAFGYSNTASGNYSSAFGKGNSASGVRSSAVGYQNTASYDKASAFGYANTAEQLGSSFGYSNSSTGTLNGKASAFGYNNTSSGDYSSSFGYANTASGGGASAMGNTNTASGITSSSFGFTNTSSGDKSSAFGYVNTASGGNSSAFGYSNTASITKDSAIGYSNTASGSYSSAFGYNNTASGAGGSAFGCYNTASGYYSSAFGYNNTASGISSSSFGNRAKTTVNNTFEAGYWSNSTTRVGAIRIHPNGQVAMTIEDSASAPTDGGATAGSEANGTLARGMFAIQKNGTAVTLYYNNGGTIQSLSLGTLS